MNEPPQFSSTMIENESKEEREEKGGEGRMQLSSSFVANRPEATTMNDVFSPAEIEARSFITSSSDLEALMAKLIAKSQSGTNNVCCNNSSSQRTTARPLRLCYPKNHTNHHGNNKVEENEIMSHSESPKHRNKKRKNNQDVEVEEGKKKKRRKSRSLASSIQVPPSATSAANLRYCSTSSSSSSVWKQPEQDGVVSFAADPEWISLLHQRPRAGAPYEQVQSWLLEVLAYSGKFAVQNIIESRSISSSAVNNDTTIDSSTTSSSSGNDSSLTQE